MADKIVRVSYDTWNKLRTFAFYNESNIKAVVNDIVDGKRDTVTGKLL